MTIFELSLGILDFFGCTKISKQLDDPYIKNLKLLTDHYQQIWDVENAQENAEYYTSTLQESFKIYRSQSA